MLVHAHMHMCIYAFYALLSPNPQFAQIGEWGGGGLILSMPVFSLQSLLYPFPRNNSFMAFNGVIIIIRIFTGVAFLMMTISLQFPKHGLQRWLLQFDDNLVSGAPLFSYLFSCTSIYCNLMAIYCALCFFSSDLDKASMQYDNDHWRSLVLERIATFKTSFDTWHAPHLWKDLGHFKILLTLKFFSSQNILKLYITFCP